MMIMYVLTKEGRNYSENGLPEKNLMNLLEKGPVDMTKAMNLVESFSVALQWCKKKGIIEIKNGMIFLKEKVEFAEEKALHDVDKSKEIDEKTAQILIQRKLIETGRETME